MLRVPLLVLALLPLALLVPAADAAACRTIAGWTVCVTGSGTCAFVGVYPPFTDFYPGAGACPTASAGPGGVSACGNGYAGFGTLGGFYGVASDLCASDSAGVTGCAGTYMGHWFNTCELVAKLLP